MGLGIRSWRYGLDGLTLGVFAELGMTVPTQPTGRSWRVVDGRSENCNDAAPDFLQRRSGRLGLRDCRETSTRRVLAICLERDLPKDRRHVQVHRRKGLSEGGGEDTIRIWSPKRRWHALQRLQDTRTVDSFQKWNLRDARYAMLATRCSLRDCCISGKADHESICGFDPRPHARGDTSTSCFSPASSSFDPRPHARGDRPPAAVCVPGSGVARR